MGIVSNFEVFVNLEGAIDDGFLVEKELKNSILLGKWMFLG